VSVLVQYHVMAVDVVIAVMVVVAIVDLYGFHLVVVDVIEHPQFVDDGHVRYRQGVVLVDAGFDYVLWAVFDYVGIGELDVEFVSESMSD